MLTYRPFQENQISAITLALASGDNPVLVPTLPTGSGNTLCLASAIIGRKHVLFVASHSLLCSQFAHMMHHIQRNTELMPSKCDLIALYDLGSKPDFIGYDLIILDQSVQARRRLSPSAEELAKIYIERALALGIKVLVMT